MAWNDGIDANSPAHRIGADDSRRIRVVAGPGTGKSFALKRRVARLLEQNVNPKRILPVTFTRVAAEDLHRELQSLQVRGCDELQGRTLHSLGLRILMRRNVLESTRRIPRPLNDFECEPLLYDLHARYGDKRQRKKKIKAFEAAWARLQHEEPGFPANEEDANFERDLIGWLQFHGAMLIGEIVPQLYTYLRSNPAAPEYGLFDHVLVDEFQDLNRAEQAVIELLSTQAALCIVGDDDQSIYSFRHAHPQGIRQFHLLHTDVTDHQLLDCQRCPIHVVSASNNLIGNNADREQRRLVAITEKGDGIISVQQYLTLNDEANGIADFIQSQINEGVRPGEILILAQRRVIGNPICEALRARNIPVRSFYQESALETEVAQERISILKLLANNEDRVSLRWLLGYGHTTYQASAYARVRSYSHEHGLSPWQVLTGLAEGTIHIAHTNGLVQRFRNIQASIITLKAHQVIPDFINAWLPADMADIDELRTLANKYAAESESPQKLLENLMDEISNPEIPLEVAEVRIMSLHKSKGLSAPVVVIAGCVEGLLPAPADHDLTPAEQQAQLEEQRRLFYVGLTRVKASPSNNKPGVLMITNATRMTTADAMASGIRANQHHMGTAYLMTSRFIREMGALVARPTGATA